MKEKNNLHPKNNHRQGYDFNKLIDVCPELKSYVFINEHNNQTIDFSDSKAVFLLNKSLLESEYEIKNWSIPLDYLCPPIPGRMDYILYLADLLAESNGGIIPEGEKIIGLDIGVGANCIYPILGNSLYNWSFVGTDIDNNALENCKKIIRNNPKLIDVISLQLQVEARFIFKNIILPDDRFAFIICNPPFHNSKEDALKSNIRKINNLTQTRKNTPSLNFGGQSNELWCDGGEISFITQMIFESAKYAPQVLWFTTLVSKKENLNSIYKTLKKVNVTDFKTIEMSQGQKTSRIVCWTFQLENQVKSWFV